MNISFNFITLIIANVNYFQRQKGHKISPLLLRSSPQWSEIMLIVKSSPKWPPKSTNHPNQYTASQRICPMISTMPPSSAPISYFAMRLRSTVPRSRTRTQKIQVTWRRRFVRMWLTTWRTWSVSMIVSVMNWWRKAVGRKNVSSIQLKFKSFFFDSKILALAKNATGCWCHLYLGVKQKLA